VNMLPAVWFLRGAQVRHGDAVSSLSLLDRRPFLTTRWVLASTGVERPGERISFLPFVVPEVLRPGKAMLFPAFPCLAVARFLSTESIGAWGISDACIDL
jgi:hypothetical protein